MFKEFIYLFLERGEGRQKERERDIDVRERHPSVASGRCPSWGPNPQPGVCPDKELNRQPVALRDDIQLTEHTGQDWC